MTPHAARPFGFGLAALVLGFLAFAAVVGHFAAGPIDPAPPLEVSLAEQAGKIRDATVAALRGEDYAPEPQPRTRSLDDLLETACTGAALLALALSLVALIRREPLRIAVASGGLALLAISFQIAITLFFVLIAALLLTALMDALDFSF